MHRARWPRPRAPWRRRLRDTAGAAIAAVLPCLLLVAPLAAQKVAQVGESLPEFAFPKFLNGDGRQGITEFFGQPVMIDFWGTH